ncbi:MAG: hypothetical protein KDD52_01670 [Bdellovibrionales bacterium]|nr:hypothetical protein [Bdellovibrionales bacterium]
MKKLIVSLKTSTEVLDQFKTSLKQARKGKIDSSHYEISFDSKKDFDKFVRNISILTLIQNIKPQSIYELAKLSDIDVSNLNKIILFFEEIGAIEVEKKKIKGRETKIPKVPYKQIQFDLEAA